MVVGAYQDDTGQNNSGSAYVYDLSSDTPTVPIVTLNNPDPAVGDWFGTSVAISGTRVAIGACGDETGTLVDLVDDALDDVLDTDVGPPFGFT